MRVIICGVGQVGYHIAGYLSRENNDVTVIDINARLVDQISDDLDVNGVVGHASKPHVLSAAGVADADLFIAVTHSDEVNMVACQVAHSLFNVPKKIARIRDESYLDPAWFNLFSRSQMPIDVIISPEKAVADSLADRLSVPGTTNVVKLGEGLAYMLGVSCLYDCPVVNTSFSQFSTLFPDLNFKVGYIFREGKGFVPGDMDQLLIGDEAFLVVEADQMKRVLSIFGHEESKARRITLMGGGNIGRSLANALIDKDDSRLSIRIVEKSRARAVELGEEFGDSLIVLNGDCLNSDLLREVDVSGDDVVIMVTDDDEANILGALLAKQGGCETAISLVNKSSYSSLLPSLGIDVTVSPRAITVSSIMQHVRRGRIKAIHTLRDGSGEVIEAEVSETSGLVNRTVGEIDAAGGAVLCSIIRDSQVLPLKDDMVIRSKDRVVIIAEQSSVARVEALFSVQVDLF